MRVGLCFTKPTPDGKSVLHAFLTGIKVFGDKVIKIGSYKEYLDNRNCDVYAMFGWFQPQDALNKFHSKTGLVPCVKEEKTMRGQIYTDATKNGKKVIVIDTGFYPSKGYRSVGIGGLKNDAQYFTRNCDSKRLLNNPEEYRKNGEHVLIFGQNRFGVSCYEIDIFEWHLEICKKIYELTKRPIVFRKHPRGKVAQPNSAFPGYVQISYDTTLAQDLKNCWVAIGYTTNALCEALFKGIPIITPAKRSICYDIAEHKIKKLEEPKLFSWDQRMQFFCDLSYKQWTNEEIAKGLPWQYLRPYV